MPEEPRGKIIKSVHLCSIGIDRFPTKPMVRFNFKVNFEDDTKENITLIRTTDELFDMLVNK